MNVRFEPYGQICTRKLHFIMKNNLFELTGKAIARFFELVSYGQAHQRVMYGRVPCRELVETMVNALRKLESYGNALEMLMDMLATLGLNGWML